MKRAKASVRLPGLLQGFWPGVAGLLLGRLLACWSGARGPVFCLILLLVLSVTRGMGADPVPEYAVPNGARLLESASRARSLLFIPLRNNTGNPDLDYLSYGVPSLLFSNIRTVFLIQDRPLTGRRLTPIGKSTNPDANISSSGSEVDDGRTVVFLKASLLDFRSAAVRERQKGLPEKLSRIPAKEKEIMTADPADIAIRYGAHWYVEGTLEMEPVPDPYYVDPKGNRIRITPEMRAQLAGKELPRALARLLRETRSETVIVKMSLRSFERGGILWSDTFRLSIRNPYEGVDFESPAHRLEEAIRQQNPHVLHLRAANSPGFVFLNDTFAGKTPLDIRVPAGRMSLRIEQDGCKHFRRELNIPESPAEVVAGCDTFRGKAVLEVTSQPDGADVFLDHEWIGKAPLKRRDLAPGVHRLRVSAKGHVDGFYGVQLSEERPTLVSAILRKGDTVAYYTDPGYAIQDWTYEDLSFGLLLHSLVGYGGWRYATIRANAERTSVRGYFLPSFIPQPSYTYLQYRMIEDARLRALKWERTGKGLAGMGAVSFLAAGYYLYRALEHDERPSGELPDTGMRLQWMIAPVPAASSPFFDRRPAVGFGLAVSF